MSDEREPLWSDTEIAEIIAGMVSKWEAAILYSILRGKRDEYEAQLSNQYQRIERFVELVDQLERKLQEATEANTSCTIYIASQMERIGDLEAQLAQPYSHRNGETEPPMKEGWYAMQHPQAWNWQGSTFVFVERDTEDTNVYCAGQDDPIGYNVMDKRIKWYGPIVPPWEVDHE